MTPRQIADQMIAARQREIAERNAYLRGEVANLHNITLSQAQVDAALSQMGQGGRV